MRSPLPLSLLLLSASFFPMAGSAQPVEVGRVVRVVPDVKGGIPEQEDRKSYRPLAEKARIVMGTEVVTGKKAGTRIRIGTAGGPTGTVDVGPGSEFVFEQWIPEVLEGKASLSVQIGYLLAHPGTDVVIGAVERSTETGVELDTEFLKHEMIAQEYAEGINLMAMTARASAFASLGMFDPSYRLSEDYQWLVRAHRRDVTIALVPRVVGRRRLHETNVSSAVDDVRNQMFRVLREHIRERRGS